ncbi:hypothetical protein BDQ17DRAFT_873713 [Cyathus striatus]|nr:hypothetical protein BDQ17DRAFT_873713 [Cyathus striatus]
MSTKELSEAFTTKAALVLHFESGKCGSRINKAVVDDLVRKFDRNHIITDPSRMLTTRIQIAIQHTTPPKGRGTDMPMNVIYVMAHSVLCQYLTTILQVPNTRTRCTSVLALPVGLGSPHLAGWSSNREREMWHNQVRGGSGYIE